MLQPWQAYHALTYESKWKHKIDCQWEALTAAWDKDNPGIPRTKTRFEFMNTFIRGMNETEGVEDYRHDTSPDDVSGDF